MNCPRDGNVADIMRRTRAQYQNAIRRLKSNNELLRKSAMARVISYKKSRNLWSEVNKVRSKKSTISNNIDDIQGDDNIAELFSEKYVILYNSVTYEQTVMDELLCTNEKDVISHCVSATDDNDVYTHVINVDQVTSAVHKYSLEYPIVLMNFYPVILKIGHSTYLLLFYFYLLLC